MHITCILKEILLRWREFEQKVFGRHLIQHLQITRAHSEFMTSWKKMLKRGITQGLSLLLVKEYDRKRIAKQPASRYCEYLKKSSTGYQ